MKHVKRVLSLMLVLCMVVTLTQTAFATENVTNNVSSLEEATGGSENEEAKEPVVEDDAEDTGEEKTESEGSELEETEPEDPAMGNSESESSESESSESGDSAMEGSESEDSEVNIPTGEEPATEEPEAEENLEEKTPENAIDSEETSALEMNLDELTDDIKVQTENPYNGEFLKVVHLDAGRKYFSVSSIKAIIDIMAESGYNYLELAIGNDGMRFLLDDMSLTVGDNTYESDAVKAAIQNGNKAYADFGTNELVESEMDEIISYASEKGISIIPLLNTPGHMDAILDAMTELGVEKAAYGDGWRVSGRTVDVTNEEAKAFTLAFVNKYIQYFAGKGCSIFNIGADEYANDVFTSGGMGFGELQSQGQYGAFVDFVNDMAAQIKATGMTPMAFNDGIYYNRDMSSGTIDNDILIAYWSSGWSGYNVASASFLAEQGFNLINTNGDYYWIVGGSQCSADKAAEFDVNSFMGEDTALESAGAMFCIWSDYPDAMSEQEVVNGAADVIAAFGNAISNGNETDPDDPETGNATDPETNISVTAPGVTAVTVEPLENAPEIDGTSRVAAYDITPYAGEEKYTGEATVSIPVPEGWDTSLLHAYVQETDGSFTRIDGTYADGMFTYTAPHFSVQALGEDAQEIVPDERIEVAAGSSTTITIPGVDLSGDVDTSKLDEAIATVDVQAKQTETENSWQLVTNGAAGIVPGDEYLIVSGSSGTQYALTSSGGASRVSISDGKIENAPSGTVFKLNSNGEGYSLQDENGKYLYPTATRFFGWNYGLSTNNNSAQAVKVSGNSSVTISCDVTSGWNSTTSYIRYGSRSYSASAYSSSLYLYHHVETEAGISTEITFNGVSEGTTYVTVGDKTYEIVVTDQAPSEALTGRELEVEYWITNSMVRESANENSSNSTTISRDEASGEDGIAITDKVPEKAYSNYDGWVELHFWQAMRLDSDNHQTGEGGDDETADGSTFTHVRWHNEAWQYMTTDGVWHYFMSGDQAVAYYMRHTEITKEITTAMKDWGYDPDTSSGTEDTSGGDGQVALSVAVVYSDNSLSPAEEDIYLNSTTIFNYWDGRDIGIIAPLNNSEYEVSKITVTDGTRDERTWGNRRNENVWYNSDTITWEKVETDSGSLWYDETEVWNSSMGTEPMVNGKVSNITWPAKSTAKLVLIYLQPVHHDSNLTVNWVDDSANEALINSMEVVVSYEGSNETTFYNGLKQTSALPEEGVGGTFTLDDDAYITNSSGVNQTFNKDITVMDVDPQYRSGLYQYISAELSADGKTLTLHYNLNTELLSSEYVVDFGLPVQVPVSDLVENADQVQSVTSNSEKISYDNSTKTITYTPSEVLTGIDAVTVRVNYSESTQRFNIGFAPATNVYYEEGFADYSDGWTGYTKGSGIQQTAKPGKEGANQYGYDEKYANEANSASNGTAAVSEAYGDNASLTFTGTGIDIYTNSTPASGRLFITVTNSAGKIVKLVQVETALKNGYTPSTEGQAVNGYNVPVVSLDLGARDTYTVNLSHMKTTAEDTGDTVSIDGYRVYGTLDESREAYVFDKENNPTYVELRDQVLAALNVNTGESQYADEIAKNALSQVYSKAGTTVGAVLLSVNDPSELDAQDLLDNGPKNELYLRNGESVVFKVNAANGGNVQIGLKALNAAVNYSINGKAYDLTSSTDMFYKLDVNAGEEETVTITNNSGSILSITKIKFPGTDGTDDASFFGALSETDLMPALMSLGFESGVDEPEIIYADAVLDIVLKDADGREVASTAMTINGIIGEKAVFTAAEIEKATEALVPAGYELKEAFYKDIEVAYGDSSETVFSVSVETQEETGENPDSDEKPTRPGNIFENIVNKVVNTVKDIFRSLFGR